MDEQQSFFEEVEEKEEKALTKESEIDSYSMNGEVTKLDKSVEPMEMKEGKVVLEEEEMIELEDGRKFTLSEWETPVFGGGPTRAMVEEWKAEWGKIYMVPFDFDTFIIRGLTRPEYRSIQEERAKLTESTEQEPLETRLARKFDNEELISAICTLWPMHAQTEEFFMEKAPAGTAGILAEMIYDKSAFRALTPPIAL